MEKIYKIFKIIFVSKDDKINSALIEEAGYCKMLEKGT